MSSELASYYDCFICSQSFPRANSQAVATKARSLFEFLKKAGFSTFFTDNKFQANPEQVLLNGLQRSAVIIVLLTTELLEDFRSGRLLFVSHVLRQRQIFTRYSVITVVLDKDLLSNTGNKAKNPGFLGEFQHNITARDYVDATDDSPFINYHALFSIQQKVKFVLRRQKAVFESIQIALNASFAQNDQSLLVPYQRSKLLLVGNGQAGKSSTVRSLLSLPFQKDILSTVVADAEHEVEFSSINAKNWTEKKSEKLSNVLKGEFLDHAIQAIRNNKVELSKEYFKPETSESTEETEKTEKKDEVKKQPHTQVSVEEIAQRFEGSYVLGQYGNFNKNYSLEDKKAGQNVTFSIWDFGGQEIFTSVHNLFLSKHGIYLLVFSLQNFVNNSVSETEVIKFWLNSLNLHASEAPVLIIGTHFDVIRQSSKNEKQVSLTLKKVDKMLKTVLEQVNSNQIILNKTDKLRFFPLDNSLSVSDKEKEKSSNSGIDLIRENIENVTLGKDKRFNVSYLTQPIKLNWLYFMDSLLDKNVSYLDIDSVYKEAESFELQKELYLILDFFSQLGVIIFFQNFENDSNSEQSERIQNLVVFKPQFLLDAISCFLYDPEIHDKEFSVSEESITLLRNYEKTAILPIALLNELWKEYSFNERHFFEKVFKNSLIISPYIFQRVEGDDNKNKNSSGTVESDNFSFLVPSMLKDVELDLSAFNSLENSFLIKFGVKILPKGLFERLLCLFVKKSGEIEGSKSPKLSKRAAKISFAAFGDFSIELATDVSNKDKKGKNEIFEEGVKVSVHEKDKLILLSQLIEFVSSFVLTELKNDSFLGAKLEPKLLLFSVNQKTKVIKECEYFSVLDSLKNKKEFVISANNFDKVDISTLERYFYNNSLFSVSESIDKNIENEIKDIFMSHEWGTENQVESLNFKTHKIVEEINANLVKSGFKTWFDGENMDKLLDISMANGIKNSKLVMVFLTERYMERLSDENNNCTKEFKMAVKKGVNKIIIVLLDKSLADPKTWNGIFDFHLSQNKYINMSSDTLRERNFNELCKEIEKLL